MLSDKEKKTVAYHEVGLVLHCFVKHDGKHAGEKTCDQKYYNNDKYSWREVKWNPAKHHRHDCEAVYAHPVQALHIFLHEAVIRKHRPKHLPKLS